ncbi:hypothetical protein MCOR27_008756 [Pyricularia oryzae]|uniref:Charged multivesicular body protein 5 n=2 Tax=Pyricularia TaxID=48558 RepID=A0ABQ8ND62_PYRGI|nr:hypothetical protein MCOR01_003753 [Pyricularia oryzae]KAI6294323.1 hypothetical protein MCOR33_008526 [Pyricularia grisea]KAH9427281.1 hypothetical protein MCOR02_012186 [Pyricularia oryzae]KAI6255007.1 hypothetical protein MCOR19_008493 [Pyricularia oryzae]KAI6268125.1 hypothetical protein MCOR26_009354 [Pyricularia oryzae]
MYSTVGVGTLASPTSRRRPQGGHGVPSSSLSCGNRSTTRPSSRQLPISGQHPKRRNTVPPTAIKPGKAQHQKHTHRCKALFYIFRSRPSDKTACHPPPETNRLRPCVNHPRAPPTMRRVFGSAPTAPKATLDDSVTALESRRSKIEVSIKAKENEIAELNRRRAATRSAAAQNALKTKALRILRRMKEDEAQMNNVQSQIDNLQKMQDMQGTLKNSAVMVDTMRQTQKELKKQYGKFDIDKIEKMQDEMADLLDMSNEIQESLSRGYDVGEDIDEADLEAELDAIGEEVEFEREMGVGGAVPSFLEDEVPDFIDEPPVVEKKVQEAAR